jgi:hypothetical protein
MKIGETYVISELKNTTMNKVIWLNIDHLELVAGFTKYILLICQILLHMSWSSIQFSASCNLKQYAIIIEYSVRA